MVEADFPFQSLRLSLQLRGDMAACLLRRHPSARLGPRTEACVGQGQPSAWLWGEGEV